jgi:hypothetical protein
VLQDGHPLWAHSKRIRYFLHVVFHSRFSFLKNRAKWYAFVEGKTVAVVGPAATPHDQSDEIEAHDIVIRVGYHHWPWPNTGSRTDVWLLDWEYSKLVLREGATIEPPETSWLLLGWPGKNHLTTSAVRETKGIRFTRIPLLNPRIWARGRGKYNQVTQLIMELYFLRPKHITVFGVDFYTTPGDLYDPNSKDYEWAVESHHRTIRDGLWHHHNQLHQKQIASEIQRRRGFFLGDKRYIALIETPDNKFLEYYSEWKIK